MFPSSAHTVSYVPLSPEAVHRNTALSDLFGAFLHLPLPALQVPVCPDQSHRFFLPTVLPISILLKFHKYFHNSLPRQAVGFGLHPAQAPPDKIPVRPVPHKVLSHILSIPAYLSHTGLSAPLQNEKTAVPQSLLLFYNAPHRNTAIHMVPDSFWRNHIFLKAVLSVYGRPFPEPYILSNPKKLFPLLRIFVPEALPPHLASIASFLLLPRFEIPDLIQWYENSPG